MYRNTYIKIEFTMEKKEENYPPYDVFREQYGRLAEEIGISFEESLLFLITYNGTMSGNYAWKKNLIKCNAERIRNNKRAS